MSKNFEEEYKSFAQMDLPDLWDRIEAGISEKEPVSTPGVLVFFRRYQTVAAALLCVMILIPAFLLMRQVGGGMSKSTTDGAPAEVVVMTEAAAEESIETETAAAPMEEIWAEEAPAAEAPAAEAPETEAEVEDVFLSENSAGEDFAKKESATEAVTEAMSEEMKADRAESNVTGYPVSIEIIREQETSALAEKERADGRIYRCMVLEDKSGQLEAKEEILIWIPTSLVEEPKQGDSYELTLEQSNSEYYDFIAESLHD